jgi:manganese transport protein
LLFGPAFVAAIAYVDPGNVAANVSAGAQFGFLLVWVIVVANAMACVVQYLSAKLGLVSGQSLPEAVGSRMRRGGRLAYWLQAELVAMATDLAEVMGGAIALYLLFDLPLFLGGVITGAVSLLLLVLKDRRGQQVFERVVTGLLLVIAIGFFTSLFVSPPPAGEVAAGLLPKFAGPESVLIAAAMLGATVMPHAVYLHSGLMQDRPAPRNDRERRLLLRFSNREVVIALAAADLINMAMVLMAAAAFHAGHRDVAEIGTAYQMLSPLLGSAAAWVFLISLIASGASSSAVGTMAGQMIMQGFVGFAIPIWVRRLVTMLPAFVVVGLGLDATRALVLSQVVLSFALPIPMLALVLFTRRPDIMGRFANRPLTDAAAIAGSTLVLGLNLVLLWQLLG